MFATLTALVIRLAAIRWAIKSVIGLGVLLPVAAILKFVGLPVLAVLGVLSAPVLLVLFILGLPVFMVLAVGAMLLAGLFFLLTMGMVVFKFLLFVVLPLWLVWKLACFLWRLVRPSRTEPATSTYAGSQV